MIGDLLRMKAATGHVGSADAAGGVLGSRSSGSLLGIDSIPNFSSYFYEPGAVPAPFGDFAQYTWQYTMVGKSPFRRGDDDDSSRATRIDAPIIPVTVDLRNVDGSPRFVGGLPPDQFASGFCGTDVGVAHLPKQ
jgi:hypothetical protein